MVTAPASLALERRVRAGDRPLPQGQEQVGEVDSAEEHADRRHDDVVDQALHHGAERGADDDADGQVDDVAATANSLNSLIIPMALSPRRFSAM